MGKRSAGLTGLSRYVLESFKKDAVSLEPSTVTPVISSPAPAPEPIISSSALPDRQHDGVLESRPAKRRKTKKIENSVRAEERSQWVNKYEATGLVPHYTSASQVPPHLLKYFSQRTRFLSLYSTPPGCLLDTEGWYSITPELIADQIAERCRCDTVLDAFCGVGGNAIAFAKTCQRVIALDISATRLALARHNAQIYGVADRIEFILSDYISFARAYLSRSAAVSASPTDKPRQIDVVFLSPPWGGPAYLSGTPLSSPKKENATIQVPEAIPDESIHPEYSLASIQPIHGAELFRLTRKITQNVAYYLPRNMSMEEVSALLTDEIVEGDLSKGEINGGKRRQEMIEVEEEYMSGKLKALTCYFGGLAAGQEEMF